MKQRAVFVDVDVQRDFCEPSGALYVVGSPNELFLRLTREAMARSIPIVGSVDSHAFDAWEFASNGNVGPNGEDPRFPDHCVKGTAGWLKIDGTLPSRFRFVPNVPVQRARGVDPGTLAAELAAGGCQALYFEKEVYSLFANPVAEVLLASFAARVPEPLRFLVYGVATDYCIKAAALGLRERGYETVLLTDAVAGIAPAGVAEAFAEMQAAGVQLVTSGDALASLG